MNSWSQLQSLITTSTSVLIIINGCDSPFSFSFHVFLWSSFLFLFSYYHSSVRWASNTSKPSAKTSILTNPQRLPNEQREYTHLRLQCLCNLSAVKSRSLRMDGESCKAVSLLCELSDVSPSPSSPGCCTYTCDICTEQDLPPSHVVCGSRYTLPIPAAADRADISLSYCCRLISTVSPELWTVRSWDLEIKYYAMLWGSK